MKKLSIYFSIILFASTAVFGQNQKLSGFNNYSKWIDKGNDNIVYPNELLNLDEFVLNDKGTFSFLVMLPPPESFWTWQKNIPSQNFIIEAKDNNTGKEWKVYESFCTDEKISWFEMKPISGNITLTCTYTESDIQRSLTYNYKPEDKEVDQYLNYYLSEEQIQALSKLNEDKIHAYKDSKSVSLVVVQNYAQLVNMDLPFRKIAERLLKYTGLEIVNDRSSSFDLQIIINVNGTSIRGVSIIKEGQRSTKVTIYPEVGFNGNIIFRSANKAYYSNAFTCKKKFNRLDFTKKGFTIIHSWDQIIYGYKDMLYNESFFFKVFGEMLINAFELNPVDFYLYALTDENEAISYKAIKLLGELHDARAYNPLVELYEKESERLKKYALLDALAEMHDLRAIDFLMEVFDESDLSIRIHVAEPLFNALVEMHDPRAFNVLIEALDDPTIMGYSVTALAKLDDQRAVEPLLLALNDMSYYYGIVKNVVQTLGSLGDAIAVKPLIHSIDRVNNNKLWTVKEQRIVINTIIEVLGDFGDPKAIDYIIPLLKKNNLKANAQKALIQLTGENMGDKYKDWIKWWKEYRSEYLH